MTTLDFALIDQPELAEQALSLHAKADVRHANGTAMIREGDHLGAQFEIEEAQAMHGVADAFLTLVKPPRVGNGGELVSQDPNAACDYPRIVDTVRKDPDAMSADASMQRLHIASEAGVLTLGVDAAQSIRARNSLEKMLAHQLAALHVSGMAALARSRDLMRQHKASPEDQSYSIEAARNANAAARLMTAFQDGLLVVERLRRGGRQTVRVTHVHQQVAVGRGGKAVVAGSIRGRRGSRGRGRQKK